jgi:hypothetical protein
MSATTDTGRLKLLYVGGLPRSGSTILTRVLGELPDTYAAGELRIMWERSFIDNQLCGCGQPFHSCEFWQDVIKTSYGSLDAIDPQWMIDNQGKHIQMPLMAIPGSERFFSKQFSEYVNKLDVIYRTIAEKTDSRILIDSSKAPRYLYMLGLMPSFDVYVVHVTRDPRAVQYSVMKRKRPGVAHNVVTSTMSWSATNAAIEMFGRRHPKRYLLVRYEDFVENPTASLRQVTRMLGEPNMELPEITDGTITLNPNHTVLGGSIRFAEGPVKINLDSVWQQQMDERTQTTVARSAFPLMRHYGYERQPQVTDNAV